MVTKAELEAELAELKRELAEREATEAAAEADAPQDRTEPAGPDEKTAPDPVEQMREALAEALKSHGVDPADLDLDGLWKQLSDEIADLARQRPALTAVTAFALGFILGRVSK